ncbi:PhnA domain-containing protein [Promicromonospora kroppenstedtii]|uniref:PhnA domain-containing protein n=1 Tax=Promicromonospora kroppenstedtii TaxID=440482 RepID=UPI00146FBD36|nr:PhnA domain-containing protein [Promicromonospora kroppenstedtii]
MTKTWNPEIRARRIPGPSVRTVSVIGLFSVLVLLLGVVFFFITAATAAPDATPVVLKTFAALTGATMLVASACDLWVRYGLQAAELRAGYTTAYRTPDRVPYVDPRSNRVIRLAGEPELDRDEHRCRLALAREAARRDKELRRLRGAPSEPEPSDWAAVIRDAAGTPLADGDTVIVLKRLSGKGSSAVVPAGTRLRNIRLRHEAEDDRLVGAVARGVGPVRLRPTAVRKP